AAGSAAGSGAPAAASGAAAAGSAGPGSDVLIGLASKPPAWPATSPRQRGRAQPTEPPPPPVTAVAPGWPARCATRLMPGGCVNPLRILWLPKPAARVAA